MKFLLLNQTFHPDVVSTAQHLTDLALALAERGHAVTVVTSRRAYDDPATQFPKAETWRGIQIHRIGTTSLGKGAKWRRAVDFASFIVTCGWRLLFVPKPEVVVALTSPPLISFIGALYAKLRGVRFVYWVMDLNPDEAIAAGWLRENSFAGRFLHALSRYSFQRARRIIALDRFMRDRIIAKGIAPKKITVIPPWSHDEAVRFDAAGRDRFRAAHGLAGKFVVMYSGNHSPCHPLDTVLDAAKQLAGDPRFVFLFVGGGSEFRKIQKFAAASGHSAPGVQRRANNILCLPYQPINELSASLSAADLHLVAMGNPFVGLIHPCKIYNILAVGAPVLCIGPTPSHLTEIIAAVDSPDHSTIAHGDTAGCVEAIRRLREARRSDAAERRAQLPAQFAQHECLPRFIAELEQAGGDPD